MYSRLDIELLGLMGALDLIGAPVHPALAALLGEETLVAPHPAGAATRALLAPSPRRRDERVRESRVR